MSNNKIVNQQEMKGEHERKYVFSFTFPFFLMSILELLAKNMESCPYLRIHKLINNTPFYFGIIILFF